MLIPDELYNALSIHRDTIAEPVQGGAVNHVYALKDRNDQYLVKWLGDDTFSGIDRQAQFRLQQQLARYHIAPEPLWLSPDNNWWVERLEARHFVKVQPGTLGEILGKIHSLPIAAPLLNLPERLRHYLTLAAPPPDSQLNKNAQLIINALYRKPVEQTEQVCGHNDLSAGHILRLSPLMIIDWEYSGAVNRFFDIASCCAINNYSENQCGQLYQAYATATGIALPHITEQISFYSKVVNITDQLWAAAMNTTSDN